MALLLGVIFPFILVPSKRNSKVLFVDHDYNVQSPYVWPGYRIGGTVDTELQLFERYPEELFL